MNQTYLFIVITPVKNDLRIKKLINSLISQSTFKQIEFIISFNGANKKFINEIVALTDFSNIKYLQHANASTPNAINNAIKIANSQKIVILDSDCGFSAQTDPSFPH